MLALSLWITGTIVCRPSGVPRGPILGHCESPGRPDAFSASISRRAARAPSRFGGRRPPRAPEKGGTRVEGTFPFQPGENALVFGEGPENGMVRFHMREAEHGIGLQHYDR